MQELRCEVPQDVVSVDAELDRIRRDFPGWSFFYRAGVWYAAGLCSCCESRQARTLHAPDADGLRDQLAMLSARDRSEIERRAIQAGTVL